MSWNLCQTQTEKCQQEFRLFFRELEFSARVVLVRIIAGFLDVVVGFAERLL